MSKKPTKTASAQIIDVSFKNTIEEKYLAYALSTITARSLPDVRDGLKPVHRRLLYAMLQLKLDPKSGYKKCARVVGDVIGKYHPHGDTAVYDAMVRLAQTFAVRYPLVEGQGNFGSIDGDNAAAMRYTEARLTDAAMALLANIGDDTVDFRATYDGEDSEPIVLPSAFPNLLANGSEGIAVGMATSIPPHNVGEICDGLLYLIKHPDAPPAKFLKHIPGPDFPTGGIIVESAASLEKTYTTGRGSIRMRARWHKEELSHGLYQIIVTEIPYQIQKSKLIEKIAELFKNKKLPLLGNISDESNEEIRLVLEPKNRSVDAEMLMESLFRVSDLETRFNLNMNVLTASGVPQVMNIKEVLKAFVDHRHEVLIRRSNNRLKQIAHRLEVLDGMLICYLNLDEVIRIIREEDDAKAELIKVFKLTDVQVEAILNTRLRSLRRLEEMEIKREHKELSAEQKHLKALLKDQALRMETISEEIRDIKKRFGSKDALGKRRSEFADAPAVAEISIEAFVEREPITVLCSKMGWIRSIKGHQVSGEDAKYKEGDEAGFEVKMHTTDRLIVFTTEGKCYTLSGDKLPKGKGHGEPIKLLADMSNNEDVVWMMPYAEDMQLLVAANNGKGFVVDAKDVLAQTKNGKQILNVQEGARAAYCAPIAGDHVAIIGENRKMLVFPLSQIPVMKRGQGVQLQKYKDSKMADIKTFHLKDGLMFQAGERTRHEANMKPWLGNRADVGRLPPTGFSRENRF
jgi:topoisomerase-4 subunit A